MNRRTGIFIAAFFISLCFGANGQNACVQEFLDSVNSKVTLHDGRYHVTFTFSDQGMSTPVTYQGTCYFSKDSVVFGGVGDFIIFDHDSVPLFAYMDQHFYKFDASQKQYTSAYLRRDNYFAKSSYDFLHFLAVGYLLNSNASPFDNDLQVTADSSYCDCMFAGYMRQEVLRSQQYGEEHAKRYYHAKRTRNSDTIEVRFTGLFPNRNMSRVWVIDSMKPISNGEAFVRGKITGFTQSYTLMPSKDLDDPNWVPPPPPARPGEKLVLDTVPVTPLTTVDGTPYSLTTASGKLLMLDFWWTRSPTGLKSLTDVQNLYQKYASKGVTIIGINPYDLDMDAVRDALQKAAISYPNYMDKDAAMAQLMGIYLFPTIILADPVSRKILFTHVGSTNLSDVDKAIKEQLGLK